MIEPKHTDYDKSPVPEAILQAHKHSIRHRKELEESDLCGCFYCGETFQFSEIEHWFDDGKDGTDHTAQCPRCAIDAVIGSKAGFPLTLEFLSEMRWYWFNGY